MKISEKSLRKIIKESIQEVLGEKSNKLSLKWSGNDKLIPEILDSLKKYEKDIITTGIYTCAWCLRTGRDL